MPAAAATDSAPVTDLYVGPTNCADGGSGTQAQPFCTIQAAADIVAPGQTVHVAQSNYQDPVTINRSGTPGAPIAFVGDGGPNANRLDTVLTTSASTPALTISGAHDVRISDLIIRPGAADAVDVLGSTDVSLEENQISRTGGASDTSASFYVDGASSDVSITRNSTRVGRGYGVHVASGARRVTVATNLLEGDVNGGVEAADVSGLAVTGNSIFETPCAPGVSIVGTTSATVENNVLDGAWSSDTPSCKAAGLISAAPASTGTVTTDYNAFCSYAHAPDLDYTWDGTDYATAADLAGAVPGQAGHDIEVPGNTNCSESFQYEGSPLIDSADSNAPGVTSEDYLGGPRTADDPNTANTGAGTGATDRGAFETPAQISVKPTFSPASATGAAPFALTVTPAVHDTWGEATSVHVDFGDGGGPQLVNGDTASHVYTAPGTYTATVSATDTDGHPVSWWEKVQVATTDAPKIVLTAAPYTTTSAPMAINPDSAAFTVSAGTADWQLNGGTVSFGDGATRAITANDVNRPLYYSYAHAGTYTATITTTDVLGRTSTATTAITVGDEILPLTPNRAYDSRSGDKLANIAAGATVKLSLSRLWVDYSGVDGVELTATVTNPKAAGHLIVYPDGTARPNVSLLNFAAGQTVPNLMLAKAGSDGVIDFYNSSSGPIDLLVDTVGLEYNSAQIGDAYSPVGPTRILDTRNGTGAAKSPVAANGDLNLAVAGQNGVPSDATCALLDVVTTDTNATGHLTVYGHGIDRPDTSSSNWTAGQTVSNLVFVPLVDGKVVLHNGSKGMADFVADLVGYYNYFGTASSYLPTAQTRVLDTRDGTGTGGTIAKIGPKKHIKVQIAGRNGVVATGATAATLNITAVSPADHGFLSVYPDSATVPTASSLNYPATHTVANSAVTPLPSDGAIDIYNGGTSPVDVLVDLSGYYYGYSATAPPADE